MLTKCAVYLQVLKIIPYINIWNTSHYCLYIKPQNKTYSFCVKNLCLTHWWVNSPCDNSQSILVNMIMAWLLMLMNLIKSRASRAKIIKKKNIFRNAWQPRHRSYDPPEKVLITANQQSKLQVALQLLARMFTMHKPMDRCAHLQVQGKR